MATDGGRPTQHVIHAHDPAAREALAIVRAMNERDAGMHEALLVAAADPAPSSLDPAGSFRIARAEGLRSGPICAWGAATARSIRDSAPPDAEIHSVFLAPPPNAIGPSARLALHRALARATPTFANDAIRELWSERLALPALRHSTIDRFTLPEAPTDRALLRESLAIRDDDALAIMDISGPPVQRDAHRLCFSAGVLTLAGTRCHMIAHPASQGVALAQGFVKHHGNRWGLTLDERPEWEVLSAIDVALWLIDPWVGAGYRTRRSPPTTLALEAALAQGNTVIIERHPMSEPFADAPNARMVNPGDSLAINRAIAAIARERVSEPVGAASA
jgi:hypothetical protein